MSHELNPASWKVSQFDSEVLEKVLPDWLLLEESLGAIGQYSHYN